MDVAILEFVASQPPNKYAQTEEVTVLPLWQVYLFPLNLNLVGIKQTTEVHAENKQPFINSSSRDGG